MDFYSRSATTTPINNNNTNANVGNRSNNHATPNHGGMASPMATPASFHHHHHRMSSSAQNNGFMPTVNSQMRMGQIFDDQDHQRCSEGNHRALLAETLDHLRGLAKGLEVDDWMFAKQNHVGGGSGRTEM
mmetsp:Transcript_23952/g.66960  ORF Transcript_23952/g.66960 Transcript_23952/m.66960 type:complete len:131 (-) Transcript_23952:410-802(-)